jgi:hypothetical protein
MTGYNAYTDEMNEVDGMPLMYKDWVEQYGAKVVLSLFVSNVLTRLEFENEADAVYFKLKFGV